MQSPPRPIQSTFVVLPFLRHADPSVANAAGGNVASLLVALSGAVHRLEYEERAPIALADPRAAIDHRYPGDPLAELLRRVEEQPGPLIFCGIEGTASIFPAWADLEEDQWFGTAYERFRRVAQRSVYLAPASDRDNEFARTWFGGVTEQRRTFEDRDRDRDLLNVFQLASETQQQHAADLDAWHNAELRERLQSYRKLLKRARQAAHKNPFLLLDSTTINRIQHMAGSEHAADGADQRHAMSSLVALEENPQDGPQDHAGNVLITAAHVESPSGEHADRKDLWHQPAIHVSCVDANIRSSRLALRHSGNQCTALTVRWSGQTIAGLAHAVIDLAELTHQHQIVQPSSQAAARELEGLLAEQPCVTIAKPRWQAEATNLGKGVKAALIKGARAAFLPR